MIKDKAPPRKKREIWHPAQYDVEDIRAIQALAIYAQAGDEQEAKALVPAPSDVKRALDWIVLKAAQTYEQAFIPDDPNGRVAAFVDGRRSVGQQITKLMALKPDAFDPNKENL